MRHDDATINGNEMTLRDSKAYDKQTEKDSLPIVNDIQLLVVNNIT